MKEETKKLKLIEQMAALGIDPKIVEAALEAGRPSASPDSLALEAETVLIYYNTHGKGFTEQKCPECKGVFAYKYNITLGDGLHCSDECRKAALNKIGIKWDPTKPPEERWGMQAQKRGKLPAIISSQAYEVISQVLTPPVDPE